MDPELEEAHNNLGLLYQHKKLYNRAIEKYRMAVKINPDYENGHYNLGNIYFEIGLYEDSAREFKEVERVNPEKAEIHKNIGIIYYSKLMNFEKALAYLKKYMEISPGAADGETIKKIIKQIEGRNKY